MICVALAYDTAEQLLAAAGEFARQGADLVELRLDYLQNGIDVAGLLAHRPLPVIVTCRRPVDGGKFRGDEPSRQRILEAAIAAGADYVDLEEDLALRLPRQGTTRRIVSMHDFEKTPGNLAAIHGRLAAADADIVKLATMAAAPEDNVRVLELGQQAQVPTIAFCMGELGVVSRILAGKFNAPWTYAAPDEHAIAPGQISFRRMRDLYRYSQINAQTEVYAVIADPVGHSLSPLIHNTAFASLGLNKVYVPLRVPPRELPRFMDDAPRLGIRGLSVTIPHKETIIPALDQVDPAVRGIGACNTAIYDGQHWSGYNTDYQAAMDSLESALGGCTNGASPLAGKSALLLGAGGVGKALAYGLMERKTRLVVCDGDDRRAVQLAGQVGCRQVSWADRHSIAPDVLINGTPLGMSPKVDQTPWDAESLRPGMLVFDVVYNPEYTRLLREAKAAGCTVISGVEMFVRQAWLQFRYFTGHDGPYDLMKKVLLDALR